MTTNDRQEIESALRVCEKHALPPEHVKALWRELTLRVDTYERGTPSEVDLRYSLPGTVPDPIEHLTSTLNGSPAELAPHRMWAGFHYTLTAGQRRWFREECEMTPAKTVTIAWVETWPGTLHLRSFKVVSDEHVNPKNRKHTVIEAIVRKAGEFFETSARYDAEVGVGKVLSLIVGKCKVWDSSHRWAVEDLVGVKLKGDVAIASVEDDVIEFVDQDGRQAKVGKAVFLSTVADYIHLHADEKKARVRGGVRAGAKSSVAPTKEYASIEDLLADLGNVI